MLNHFEEQEVPKDEFFDFYKELYQNLPNDDVFVHVLQHNWGVTENDQDPEFLAKLGELIQTFTTALAPGDGVIQDQFNCFDKDQDGHLDLMEVEEMTAVLGVQMERKYLNQLMKRLDVDHSKTISLAEFERLATG